ncbi:MAG: copper resistance D family protein [Opitutaceae bacterium]
MTTGWLVAARAVHIGSCLLFFSIFAFDRFVVGASGFGREPARSAYWRVWMRRWSLIALAIVLASGAAWLLLVAATMSGLPMNRLFSSGVVMTVVRRTHFGAVWEIRGLLWAAAALLTVLDRRALRSLARSGARWAILACGALLCGSLSWAGHGLDGPPWHRFADALHVVMAGCWPAGLLPLAAVLTYLRRHPGPSAQPAAYALTRRFSAVSFVSVTLLAANGCLDAEPLVGSWANLVESPYGRWLSLKIVLFGAALAIGGVNLFRLEPCLEAGDPRCAASAACRLRRNVRRELILGSAIVLVVAILGLLAMPVE